MPDLFTIAHGAGGLWEIHEWHGGYGSPLQLNTEAGDDPRIYVQRIPGLHALPDRPDPRQRKVARIGETPFPTSPDGKTVTYEGEIKASSVPVLRELRTAMLAAFADTVNEGYMDLLPQSADSSPAGRFYGKVLALDPPEELGGPKGFDRAFTLSFRLSNPRIFFPDLAVDVTGNPAAVTNTGSAPAEPVITVAGAAGTVTLTDGTRLLTFLGVPSGALVVDFAARTAKVGTTCCELDVANSDWWDPFVDGIAAGAAVSIAQTGGTGVQVQFTPATWG